MFLKKSPIFGNFFLLSNVNFSESQGLSHVLTAALWSLNVTSAHELRPCCHTAVVTWISRHYTSRDLLNSGYDVTWIIRHYTSRDHLYGGYDVTWTIRHYK